MDGRYRILGELGRGAMGVVYLAEQGAIGRKVALKVLAESCRDNPQITERFLREARLADRTGHEHIVKIFDSGRAAGGLPFLAMEFLQGETLSQLLRREAPLPAVRIRHIALQICAALGAAHRCGVVHRDLKPGNIILIERDGDRDFVKLLDFGIARQLVPGDEDPTSITVTGQLLGTPAFMAPEQCRGETVDGRADLYALGCILYQMLTGSLPFEAPSPMAVVVKHLVEPPVRPRLRLRRPVPVDLERICLKALAKRPEDRFSDAEALATALREARRVAPHWWWGVGAGGLATAALALGELWRGPAQRLQPLALESKAVVRPASTPDLAVPLIPALVALPSITWTFDGLPSAARVFVDDQPTLQRRLPDQRTGQLMDEWSFSLPADGRPHRIRMTAPRYQTLEFLHRALESARITRTMKPRAVARPSTQQSPPKRDLLRTYTLPGEAEGGTP